MEPPPPSKPSATPTRTARTTVNAIIAGSPVRSVYADADTFVWSGRTSAEDTGVLTLRFDNGVIGQCEDSWSLVGAMDSR